MKNAVFYVSYKLKKDVSIEDFKKATKKLNDEFMSKQKGYISWQQLVDGDTFADLITFETMEDAQRAANPTSSNELAEDFYSYINFNSCKAHVYSIESNFTK